VSGAGALRSLVPVDETPVVETPRGRDDRRTRARGQGQYLVGGFTQPSARLRLRLEPPL